VYRDADKSHNFNDRYCVTCGLVTRGSLWGVCCRWEEGVAVVVVFMQQQQLSHHNQMHEARQAMRLANAVRALSVHVSKKVIDVLIFGT